MTHYLLQKYHSVFSLRAERSSSYFHNRSAFLHFQYYYADTFLRFFTYGWLIYQSFLYHILSDRPAILFTPMNWFGRAFMPEFPSLSIIVIIVLSAWLSNTLCLIKKQNVPARLILFFCILYLNSLNWNYGFFSHVGHLFVLAHFFTIFVPIQNPVKSLGPDEETATSVQWAYTGFMASYSIAGLWKVLGLVAKFTISQEGISWLNSNASLYNSIVGHISWDLPLDSFTVQIFTIPYIWPIMFMVMLILQLCSFLSTIRLPLFFWIGFGTICFHLFNLIFMKIEFIITPIVLLILFFPYHIIFRDQYNKIALPVHSTKFSGKKLNALYIRIYINQEKDLYSGFYAYREYWYDTSKWYAGLFFIPGITLIVSLIFIITSSEKTHYLSNKPESTHAVENL